MSRDLEPSAGAHDAALRSPRSYFLRPRLFFPFPFAPLPLLRFRLLCRGLLLLGRLFGLGAPAGRPLPRAMSYAENGADERQALSDQ